MSLAGISPSGITGGMGEGIEEFDTLLPPSHGNPPKKRTRGRIEPASFSSSNEGHIVEKTDSLVFVINVETETETESDPKKRIFAPSSREAFVAGDENESPSTELTLRSRELKNRCRKTEKSIEQLFDHFSERNDRTINRSVFRSMPAKNKWKGCMQHTEPPNGVTCRGSVLGCEQPFLFLSCFFGRKSFALDVGRI